VGRISNQQGVPPQLVERWFKAALRQDDPLPGKADFEKLADELRILKNRADNKERLKIADVPLRGRKDVCPEEELQRKIDAVIHAAIDLEKYAGPVLPTPKGDLWLAEFYGNLKLVKSIHANPPPRRGPGQPVSPWKAVGKSFGAAVEQVLKKNGYRRATSLNTANSATVVITSKAVSWAYNMNLKPSGFVTGVRNRSRAKP
jgi:hypothetical protein